MSKRYSFITLLGLGLAMTSYAQPAPKLEFDVATIKQNKSGFPQTGGERPRSNFPLGPGSMYSPNGGEFSASNQPLSVYIMFAYKMTDHQVEVLRRQLPKWALEENFDIQAKTDKHDATKDEMRQMMQALLADRLKLTLHTTTQEVPAYGLVVAKPGRLGPGLRPHPADDRSCSNLPSAASDPQGPPAPKPPATVAGGFPTICGGAAIVPPTAPGRLAFGYRNAPLSLIALQMSAASGLDRAVVDQTGLTGNYDFLLEYSPEVPASMNSAPNTDSTGPAFRDALLEQTGLKLVSIKASLEVFVVDHIEWPSGN